ncbi:NAD-dependent epimerase/dehydratase family protein [Halarchaeum nitratireducens]|uniref:UDP-sulfoquinovose synthase n=1 Tax=Halarchaeum nitratireducens TaxID=489913 RepID=A0A830GEL6_9EURY|nr:MULTISPECIES: NAD-dependent epimerase/dehydratase family protein [Halarchaeum]MBP2252628.1 nucleoside-diphosphate-sugar epimerase [Halarchaeum solikamskense]GGN23677.1 UDP-sulfoquinovose synthase [Halarchaeum nitratireducens]
MTVLLTGADGYVGWPTALRLADRLDDRVVCVDNGYRREWVAESGSVSAVPIDSPEERFAAVDGLSYVEGDLADREFVEQLIEVYEPDTVLHAAAQPSAVYAGINGERALFTQQNNVSMTLNLLHCLHEAGLDDTHFIETTTTGVYGAPEFPIPEGPTEMSNSGESDDVPFPAMGGSWYHQTKAFDAGNMRLASGEWDMPISDVRTAIVFGTETAETREHASPTRFDFDYYFGTVVNRFCAQAVAGYPITVYGKGEQRKPMVTLEDTVESLVSLVEAGPAADDDVTVYNQVNRPVAIVELAETIAEVGEEFDLDADVEHFENPRDEDEEHEMEMDNERFRSLVDDETSLEEGIRDVLSTLVEHDERIAAHEDRFLPGVLSD